MSELRQILQDLPPAVLFPRTAAAGWDAAWDADAFTKPSDRLLSTKDHQARAQVQVRELAGRLFASGIDEGLSASEAIDVVISSADYLEARKEYVHWTEQAPRQRGYRHPSARQCFSEVLWHISPRLGRTLELGVSLENAKMAALEKLDDHPEAAAIPTSIPPDIRQANPLWFVADSFLPGPVVRGMLASHRAWALMATLDGLAHEPKWRLGLVAAAASLWGDETRAYLLLLASIPETQIPEALVPLADRISLPDAIGAQRSLMAALNHTAA